MPNLLGPDASRDRGDERGDDLLRLAPATSRSRDPFANLVHPPEVAHIFHNCKRRTAGLRETRRREWLLDIEYRKRETFAYSCEAYARILFRNSAPRARDRAGLALEMGRDFGSGDERVEPAEVADIVLEACGRRNGWKVIVARCAPLRRSPARAGRAEVAKA